MGAYKSLLRYFGVPITEYAAQQGYHESNLLILRGDMEGLKGKYPQIYENLLSCRHHSDRRTPLEYGQDLVASWLLEDHFLKMLDQSQIYQIQLGGNDRNRMILRETRVSTTSDFLLVSGSKRVPVELMNDYTGFWARTQRLHLRDNKYRSLCNSGSVLLAASIPTAQYGLFDFGKNISAKYIPKHVPYGNKPAYELALNREVFKKLDFAALRKDLEEIVK